MSRTSGEATAPRCCAAHVAASDSSRDPGVPEGERAAVNARPGGGETGAAHTVVFRLPDVGEGITEAQLVRWRVQPGERVAEDDVICEIETDKAVVELPAPCAGRVATLDVAEGETVSVGTVLATVQPEGAAPPPAAAESPPPPVVATQRPAAGGQGGAVAIRAAPSTRRRARELGVDLASVEGSGPGGRVLREDVERAAPAVMPPTRPAVDDAAGDIEREPLTPLRRTIADRMALSVSTIPHATSAFRCNAEALVRLRGELERLLGTRVSYTAMVVKAMVPALRAFPYFNARLDMQAGEILLHRRLNVGVAVHTEAGLMVPVVRDVDRRPLAEVSAEIERLATACRERTVRPDELTGGTITLSNVGSHGGHDLTGRPIINPPQSAVIAMTRIRPQPVVEDGEVVARQCLDLVTSYDHRLIDGVYAARFMERLIAVIEEPGLLLAG